MTLYGANAGTASLSVRGVIIFGFIMLLGGGNGLLLYGQRLHYVNGSNGSNTNPGTITSPWQTINYGVTRLGNGDTLLVRAGTYYEQVSPGSRKGSPSARRVIMAYPGETVIVDGQNTIPAAGYGLVHFTQGSGYWVIKNITVRNSAQLGIYLAGTGCIASGCTVYNTHETGIYAAADSSLVEDCLVYNAAMSNLNGASPANWGCGITASRGAHEGSFGVAGKDDTTDYPILRRNTVHDVWGEGLSTYESKHALLEDNTVYDCFSVHTYISDAQYVTFRRNLIYQTHQMLSAGDATHDGWRPGIFMGDERGAPRSTGDSVYQNTVMNCGICLYAYNGTNATVANNTFLDSRFSTATRSVIRFEYYDGSSSSSLFAGNRPFPPISGWTFVNNIVQSTIAGVPNVVCVSSGVTFSHNMVEAVDGWGYSPGSADLTDTAHLARTGTFFAGQLTRNYFALLTGSPAIDKGAYVGLPYNGSAPDLGALESGTGEPPLAPSIGGTVFPLDLGTIALYDSVTISFSISNTIGSLLAIDSITSRTGMLNVEPKRGVLRLGDILWCTARFWPGTSGAARDTIFIWSNARTPRVALAIQGIVVQQGAVHFSRGWNLVSIPRVPLDRAPGSLFPGITGPFYNLNMVTGNYEQQLTLKEGSGYYVQSNVDTVVLLKGDTVGGLTFSVPQAGWVLIGGTTRPVPVESVTFAPMDAQASPLDIYDPKLGAYTIVKIIEPGKGYWVYVSKPCIIRW